MADRPTGIVTFLFTDIEASTELLRSLGSLRYSQALAQQRRLLASAIEEHEGLLVSTVGDGSLAVFQSLRGALRAAVSAQRLIAAAQGLESAAMRVRMGIHTGEAVDTAGDYAGLDVHRAARICDAAHGQQILLSEAAWTLVQHEFPEDLAVRDLGAYRLKGLDHPERLFQLLTPGARSEFPPLRTLSVLPNNLPLQLTRFIGRERAIARIRELLEAGRLVTLTGTAGCGKTRLALEVAGGLLTDFSGGVWQVELAAQSDPALIPSAIASALRVAGQLTPPLSDALLDHLRSRSLLLLLDNCEHVVDACARLAESLLQGCRNLRILATSREPLKIAGESTFRVPSLSLPAADAGGGELLESEAVRLFLDRARLTQPALAVTDRDASLVAQICRRLDGIPLAIELAAVRVNVMSLEDVAARLDDMFQLFGTGGRTALPRQRTIRAAIDWSHDLLAANERILLRRLAVFAGGWTLEAAEAVPAGDGLERGQILDLLARLVDKSLVTVEHRAGGTRYSQLETVRQYSRERLEAAGEAQSLRRRHRDWCVDLAEQAWSGLLGADQATWLDRLEVEHDNLRAALAWSLDHDDAEDGLRLAGGIWRFWYTRGYSEEGRRWLEAFLSRARDVSAPVRARALVGAGGLALSSHNDYAAARSFFEESLAISRQLGDRQMIAYALNNLGLVASDQGDQATAVPLLEESRATFDEIGENRGTAVALNNLGLAAIRRDDDSAAQTLLEASCRLFRALKERQRLATALHNLGAALLRRGEHATARACFTESLGIRRDLAMKRDIAYSLEGFAALAAAEQSPARAARLLGAAKALRDAIRTPLPPGDHAGHDRVVSAVRAELGGREFAAAWTEGEALAPDQATAEALAEAPTRPPA